MNNSEGIQCLSLFGERTEGTLSQNEEDVRCNVTYYVVSKGGRPGELLLSAVENAAELDSTQYLPEPQAQMSVLLHGLGGFFNTSFNHKMAQALLTVGTANILVVDYGRLVPITDYDTAVGYTTPIGREVARFLSDVSVPLELIGFSLGAHVAGVAGHLLRTKYNQTLNRIIGLDPAHPVFSDLASEQRLDPSDADFVMVVHTAGGAMGGIQPIGDVDFYPNGGLEPQPHCVMPRSPGETDHSWGVRALVEIMCSHSAAYEYLSDSVHGGYTATRCTGWEEYTAGDCAGEPTVPMNLKVPSNLRGSYFLRTRPSPPFGEAVEDYLEPEVETKTTTMMPEHAAASDADRPELDGWTLLKGLAIIAVQALAIYLLYEFTPY